MHPPFRCLDCGAASTSATWCEHCGGRSFALAPPPEAPEPVGAAPVAQLVSLQAVRQERERARRD
jgi:hypothetical protein